MTSSSAVVTPVTNNSNLSCLAGYTPMSLRNALNKAGLKLDSVEFILPMAALTLLNVVIIVGNVMVITAVFTHSKLRGTTTNKFVVSLAVADLMVGIVVLPFSSANEVLRYWLFGDTWCRMWLAIDVWLCTASIFNLCAISLDRYIAISRPVRYPTVMSPLRAKLLIICVWILSFIICFPPLIGWNDTVAQNAADVTGLPEMTTSSVVENEWQNSGLEIVQLSQYQSSTDSDSWYILDTVGKLHQQQAALETNNARPECMLTFVPGYVIYSACGSFWVPMFGMIIFYWKIYKTAVAATDAVNRGFIDQKTEGIVNVSPSESALCRLRIHRGGTASSTMVRHSNGCISELLPRPLAVSVQRAGTRRSVDGRLQTTPRSNMSEFEACNVRSGSIAVTGSEREQIASRLPALPKIVITASISCNDDKDVNGTRSNNAVARRNNSAAKEYTAAASELEALLPADREVTAESKNVISDISETNGSTSQSDDCRQSAAKPGEGLSQSYDDVAMNANRRNSFLGLTDGGSNSPGSATSTINSTNDKRTSLIASRFAKLHFISQLRNLNKEKRAAKTVGIIVGCFMVCWAPFFTVYLAEAFCKRCTPSVLFHIFFWLGYCNSAANPFIYGLCSRDFRYAFQKFLRCKCMRTKPALLHETNGRMMTMLQTLTMQVVARGAVTATTTTTSSSSSDRRQYSRTKKTIISM